VWTRRHQHIWNGYPSDQYERFFIARTADTVIHAHKQDSHVIGHRWWTFAELMSSSEEFAPRRLCELLADIIRGDYPDPPIDCGI
jgi:hypothetical protein